MVGNNSVLRWAKLRGFALRAAMTLPVMLVAGLLVVESASAQFNNGMPNANPIGIGQAMQNSMGGSMFPGGQGMSAQQMQQLMMLRGLQGMGHHHGVQTGAPIIMDGGPPMMGPMNGYGNGGYGAGGYGAGYNNNGYNNGSNGNGATMDPSRHRTSSEKRKALCAAREQQKALARDRAAQVKAAKAKAPVKDKAPVAKNAKAAKPAVPAEGDPF